MGSLASSRKGPFPADQQWSQCRTVTIIVAVLVDITSKEQSDSILLDSERKLRGLFELSPFGIALTDMQGAFIEFNEAFY